MDLVEIQIHVGKFLSVSSLATCVRVSQAWHATFLPLLYSVISFQNERPDTLYDPTLPSEEHIQRYGNKIRDLIIRLPSRYTQELVSTARLIKKLRVIQRRERRNESNLEVMQLIANNPRIKNLELVAFRGSELCHQVVLDTEIATRLTDLRFFRMVDLDAHLVAQFLQNCEQLTTLGLNLCRISCDIKRSWGVLWPKLTAPLRTLELTECSGPGAPVLAHWMVYESPGLFERLSKLTICKLGLEDGVLTTLLGRCSSALTVLVLKYEKFSWAEFLVLKQLQETLRILHLSMDSKIWLYQPIFCTFTGIVEIWRSILYVDTVCGSEPEHPLPPVTTARSLSGSTEVEEDERGMIQEPWVCLGVKKLTLHVRWSVSEVRNTEMMDRLAKLKNLEEMELTTNYSQNDRKRWEESKRMYEKQKFFAYGAPLGRDLRRSSWKTGTFKRSDMAYFPALRWMVNTWPRLKVFKYTDVDAADPK